MINRRNGFIDLMKLIFCLGIVFNHLNTVSLPVESNTIIMRYGFLGVEFFFIVSGYLMTMKAFNEQQSIDIGNSTWKFLCRKFVIILPSYLVAWLIGFIIDQIISKSTLQMLLRNILMSLPAIMQLQMTGIPCYQVLGPTWYISAMLIGMLVFYPILLFKGNIFRTVFAPIIVLCCYGYLGIRIGMLATIEPLEGDIIQSGLLRAFAGLSLGATCFEASKYFRKNFHRTNMYLTILELFCYILALMLMRSQTILRPDFIVVILFAIAITLSFSCCTYTSKVLQYPPSWLGKLSLCIYLADAPMRNLIIYIIPDEMNKSRYIYTVLLTLAAGIAIMLLGSLLKGIYNKVKFAYIKL